MKTVKMGFVRKPRYVRVNTLYHTPDEIIKLFRNEYWVFVPPSPCYLDFLKTVSNLNPDSFTRDFHMKDVLIFPSKTQFYENELYQKGSILLQDKASCLSAFLLNPKPNSVALDMCAAPGMKTTHLSALMKNKGKIYATEKDPYRYKILCEVVEKAGCTNISSINIDALNLNSEDLNFPWCKDVEYILVDPSCSGSGIVDRVEIFPEVSNSKRLNKLCNFQFKLLVHALTSFPKVRRVVYSTCSINEEENEKVIEKVLSHLNMMNSESVGRKPQPKFRLVEPLKDSWLRRGSEKFDHGKCCLFADPKKDLTNGFFIAVFEREVDVDEVSTQESNNQKDIVKKSEIKIKR